MIKWSSIISALCSSAKAKLEGGPAHPAWNILDEVVNEAKEWQGVVDKEEAAKLATPVVLYKEHIASMAAEAMKHLDHMERIPGERIGQFHLTQIRTLLDAIIKKSRKDPDGSERFVEHYTKLLGKQREFERVREVLAFDENYGSSPAEIEGATLIRTCHTSPEQYDVYLGKQKVGYLRLRGGRFTADYKEPLEELVYSAGTSGDGIFEDYERRFHLTGAVRAIKKRHEMETGVKHG